MSTSLYDIFLNPLIGFDVVNNSDFVIVDSHSKSNFPLFNFINFVFLSDFFVFENFPIFENLLFFRFFMLFCPIQKIRHCR